MYMTTLASSTMTVPGAELTYEVRANESSTEPSMLVIGSPMAAVGIVTLASHFQDRTVVKAAILACREGN